MALKPLIGRNFGDEHPQVQAILIYFGVHHSTGSNSPEYQLRLTRAPVGVHQSTKAIFGSLQPPYRFQWTMDPILNNDLVSRWEPPEGLMKRLFMSHCQLWNLEEKVTTGGMWETHTHTLTHAFMAGLAKDYHILPILATHLSTERSWIQIPRPKRLWGRESSNPAVSQPRRFNEIVWSCFLILFCLYLYT